MFVKNILKVIVGLASIATCMGGEIDCTAIEAKLGEKCGCTPLDGGFFGLRINGQLSKAERSYIKDLRIKTLELGPESRVSDFKAITDLEEIIYLALDDTSNLNGIDQIKNLKLLVLNNIDESITKLPDSIGSIKKLTHLEVLESSITTLPKTLENLYLKELIVDGSALSGEMPSVVFKLDELETLILSGSTITKIPKKIKNLVNLVRLDVSDNQISEVSSKIGELGNLQVLNLSSNLLEKFPKDLDKLEALEELNLSDNSIADDMPEGLNGLLQLREVYLHENNEIRGATLSNESIQECSYDEGYELCMQGSLECAGYYGFDPCEKDDLINHENRCGPGYGKCEYGKCCSQHGHCGTSEKYCGIGCLTRFGECDYEDSELSEDEIIKCGPDNDNISCPSGYCCSQDGECGTTADHCKLSNFCQPEYGSCLNDTNGSCGPTVGNCSKGNCCSKWGYCGKGKDHCGKGCQSEFGICY